jgi:molybdopterin-synthase adenylyltransferase
MFSREVLAGYDPEVLQSGTVLVVGAGALGQNLDLNLGLTGIGSIRIVDRDVFEEHNRTRSPLYPKDPQIEGWKKAEVVARQLSQFRPHNKCRVSFAHAWIEELGDGAFFDVSVVASCVDSAAARTYLADHCRLNGIPLVEGGFDGLTASMSVFRNKPEDADSSGCWRCTNPSVEGGASCRDYAKAAEAAGVVPATQTVAAFLGASMAETCVQLLHGETLFAEKSLDLNLRTGSAKLIQHSRDPECPGAHRRFAPAIANLDIAPASSGKNLIAECARVFKSGFSVQLPAPLYHEIPCKSCGHMAQFSRPLHAWKREGLCRACGGNAARVRRPSASARIYTSISQDSLGEILDLTCLSLGLNHGSIVEVLAGERLVTVRLSGGPEDLFQSATEENFYGKP